LAEGEQVVLRLHQHGKTMVRPAIILVLILVLASVVIIVLPQNASHLWPLRAAIGVAALLAASVWFGGPFLRWRTTTYEVTTRRLRLREGIVSRTGRDFPLNRISDVSFRQGPLDRMLRCGRLIVESPGEHGQLELDEIPEVQRVQGILFQLVADEAVRTGRPNPLDD
jgi:membrane protein YdbS with pleckstrin-like domain